MLILQDSDFIITMLSVNEKDDKNEIELTRRQNRCELMEYVRSRFYVILKDKDRTKLDIFKKQPKKDAELVFSMDLIHSGIIVGPTQDMKLF